MFPELSVVAGAEGRRKNEVMKYIIRARSISDLVMAKNDSNFDGCLSG